MSRIVVIEKTEAGERMLFIDRRPNPGYDSGPVHQYAVIEVDGLKGAALIDWSTLEKNSYPVKRASVDMAASTRDNLTAFLGDDPEGAHGYLSETIALLDSYVEHCTSGAERPFSHAEAVKLYRLSEPDQIGGVH